MKDLEFRVDIQSRIIETKNNTIDEQSILLDEMKSQLDDNKTIICIKDKTIDAQESLISDAANEITGLCEKIEELENKLKMSLINKIKAKLNVLFSRK